MFRSFLPPFRGLLFAAFALLAMLHAAQAQVGDFSAGVVNTAGPSLWLQSNVGSTLAIAHYRVNGGAQLNVTMNSTGGGQFAYPLAASAGDRIDAQFTYNINGGMEKTSPWQPQYTVPGGAAPATAVLAPAFAPAPGSYATAQQLTVGSATPGATVMCAINGGAASPCASPLTVAASSTIVAYATKTGMANSASVSAAYTIGAAATAPSYGVVDNGTSLTLWMKPGVSASYVDAHYSLNGGGPMNVGMALVNGRYEWAIPVASNAAASLSYSFTYFTDHGRDLSGLPAWTRQPAATPAAPAISPAGGSFASAQTITITAASGATVRYTLDGSAPNASSTVYGGAIVLNAPGATVKAVAQLGGVLSTVASASYAIAPSKVVTPVFSVPAGSYASTQTVSLSSATAQATIRYTLDGSAPTAASPVYSAALTVAAPGATVSARAFKAGMADSDPATAVYTVSASTGLQQGVSEGDGSAVVWFKLGWTPSPSKIVHYRHGASGAESSVNAVYNSVLARWESAALGVTAGESLQYSFTYSNSGAGETTSDWFSYQVCGGQPACAIPKPQFSVPTGVYASAQAVTLTLPAGTPAGAKVYYTLDTSKPSIASTLYTAGTALQVAGTMTIRAITVLPGMETSAMASASYSILSGCAATDTCTVAPPVLSVPPGTYNTRIALTMMTATMGANIYYTLDGSEPTVHAARYSGGGGIESNWLAWANQAAAHNGSVTVKAVAIRNGQSSAVTTGTYNVTSQAKSTWSDARVQVKVLNNTGKPAAQVYWMIVGKRWSDHRFVWIDATGAQREMLQSDNVDPIPGREGDGVNKTTRYFHSLAELDTVSIDPIESARLYLSVSEPVKVSVTADGYAGPDFKNKTDPSQLINYDFTELNIIGPNPGLQGLWVNTSRVDLFGLPLKLEVTGLDHFSATVGEPLSESKAELITRFAAESDPAFQDLAAVWSPYRIVAPAHAYFNDEIDIVTGQLKTGEQPGKYATYLDGYISDLWQQYASEDLVLTLGGVTYRGRVNAATGRMSFTDAAGSYYIHGKPSTTEVLLGYGKLDDGRDINGVKMPADSPPYLKQLQLQAQLCAAINRHVAQLGTDKWWDEKYFYPAGEVSNQYARFWHAHSINSLAYGFAYDDVGEHSPSIYTPTPQSITVTLGR